MAIRTFNSVGGFSVGENPSNVILANGDITTSNVTLTGNLAALNVLTDNLRYANGVAWDFQEAAGSNHYIQYNISNNFAASANFTYNDTTQVLTVLGNAAVAGIKTDNYYYANGAPVDFQQAAGNDYEIQFNTSDDFSASANLTFNPTTNVLTIVGNIAGTNANLTANVSSNNSSVTNDIQAGRNISANGNVSANNASVTNDFQAGRNISANGNVSANNASTTNDMVIGRDAIISGNLTVGGNTVYINVSSLNVSDPIIEAGGTANGGNASAYDGKDRGLLLHNYYSNGSGPVNQFFGWKTANSEFLAVADVTSFTGEVVTSNGLANIRASSFLGNLVGTVNTAAQPNITSLGTLTGLTVNGNANVNNLGSSGVVIATGNVTGGNLNTAGVVQATGNVIGGNLVTAGVANVTGNVIGGNLTTAGVVQATGNVIGGNLTTAGNVVATSNVQANNAVISNNIQIGNTNVNWATITTTAITANQTIASLSATGIRGVEFLVKGEESAGGKYSIATISAVHDGSNVDYAVYGTVGFGGSTGSLSVNYSSGNIRLAVTPASSNSTVWTTQYRTI